MTVDLTTTNVLLGIMAVVSLLEAAALIAAGIIGLRLYREAMAQIRALEQKHIAPLRAQAESLGQQASALGGQVGTILQTVHRISERVEHSTTRVDAAVEGTMHKAELAVDRVQGGVRKTTGTLVGVVRGVRTAIETFLSDPSPDEARRRAKTSGNGHNRGTTPADPAAPGPDEHTTPDPF